MAQKIIRVSFGKSEFDHQVSLLIPTNHQAQDVEKNAGLYRWFSVVDGGPTLN